MPWIVDASWTTHTITTPNAGVVNTGSTEITNSGEWEYLFVDLVMTAYDPGTLRMVELHVLPRMQDGTTYPDVFLAGPTKVDAVPVATGNNSKELNWAIGGGRPPLPWGPGTFKMALGNGCSNNTAGVTLKTIGARWVAELPE
jgi:hypothetical protein